MTQRYPGDPLAPTGDYRGRFGGYGGLLGLEGSALEGAPLNPRNGSHHLLKSKVDPMIPLGWAVNLESLSSHYETKWGVVGSSEPSTESKAHIWDP